MNTDYHLYRSDVASHWCQIAEWVQHDPRALDLALGNIQRWLARGRLHPDPLLEWQRRITRARESADGMNQFLEFLRADNADSETLKSCSPFAGLCKATLPA